jgi:hypothetical protein
MPTTSDGTYQHTGPGFQTCAFCAKPGRYLQLHDEQYWHPMCWNMVQRGEAYR